MFADVDESYLSKLLESKDSTSTNTWYNKINITFLTEWQYISPWLIMFFLRWQYVLSPCQKCNFYIIQKKTIILMTILTYRLLFFDVIVDYPSTLSLVLIFFPRGIIHYSIQNQRWHFFLSFFFSFLFFSCLLSFSIVTLNLFQQ